MQRLSNWACWIAAGFFTLIVIPLLVEFLKHLAENIGLYDQPRETAGAVLNFFLSLAELPWLRVTALVLGGFVAGLWLDRLLRKRDRSRAEARENLGLEMQSIGRDMRWERENEATGRLNVGPRLGSCFVAARKVGLWAPERQPLNLHPLHADRMQNILMNYLLHVGTLLSDGHFAEAKQTALQAKRTFAGIVADSEKTKQEQKARQRG
jgi:hypothetical protein